MRKWLASTALASTLLGCASPAAFGDTMATCPTPTSAAKMNIAVNNIQGLGSGDAFRTIQLPDCRWLSLLGDNTKPGETLPSSDNAFVIWDSAGQRRVGTGNAFPRWSDGSEFWPSQPFIVGSTMYVIGSRQLVRGEFDWDSMGAWIAVVQLISNGDPKFVRYAATPSSGSDDSVVQWYAASVNYGGYAYIHGVKNRPDAFNARDAGYVARVPLTSIEQNNTWRYWAGGWWSGMESKAISTIPVGGSTTNGSESSYTLHRRPNGQWQVTTKSAGTLANTIGRYVSTYPWGPWTWQPLVNVCDLACYQSAAMPGIPTESGKLLIFHNRADTTPTFFEVAQ